MNRLIEAKTTNAGGTVLADYQYTYDGDGNRTSQVVNGSATTFTYNNANQLSSTGYSFDANGNETARQGGMTFSYNAKNQTSSITPPSASAINMAYSGKGQTQRVAAGSTVFAYNALGLGTEGSTYYTRDNSGALVGERTSTSTYYYLFDGLDSVVALTDSSGNLVATYSYDPYGQLTGSTGAVSNPWRFAGGYLDTATGLYKMGDRYYDSAVGRWTQEDSVDSSNLYLYVADNPVNSTDPSGAWWLPPRRGGRRHGSNPFGGIWRGILEAVSVPVYGVYLASYYHFPRYCSSFGFRRGCSSFGNRAITAAALEGDAALDRAMGKHANDEGKPGSVCEDFIPFRNRCPSMYFPGIHENWHRDLY